MFDAWFGNFARVLLAGRTLYYWGVYAHCGNDPPFLKQHGFCLSQAIIWHKQHSALPRQDTMGSRVEQARFAWERGIVRQL